MHIMISIDKPNAKDYERLKYILLLSCINNLVVNMKDFIAE